MKEYSMELCGVKRTLPFIPGGAAANTAAPADRTAEKTGEDVAQEGQPVQEQTTALPQPEEQTQPGPVQTAPENDPPAEEEEAE